MTEPDRPMPKPLTTFLPNSPEAKKLARWTYNYDHIKEKIAATFQPKNYLKPVRGSKDYVIEKPERIEARKKALKPGVGLHIPKEECSCRGHIERKRRSTPLAALGVSDPNFYNSGRSNTSTGFKLPSLNTISNLDAS